jgi:glycosyltransferase involved in cell wall biosynthesis
MRLLLVQSAVFLPTYGGASKANRILCELLASRGHECFVFAVAEQYIDNPDAITTYCDRIRAEGAEILFQDSSMVMFRNAMVTVFAFTNTTELRSEVALHLPGLRPDVVLISSEDPFQVLLTKLAPLCGEKLVYFAHTSIFLPFGPNSVYPNSAAAETFGHIAGIVTISRYMKQYFEDWIHVSPKQIAVPIFGQGPFPNFAQYDSGSVAMINPCAIKGLPIFLELARRFPNFPFSAVRGWGTTDHDVRELNSLPNISLLGSRTEIDLILSHTRILLVPSLWQEGFGLVAVEAMLRGIPVLASNTGGLAEAKLGVDYVIPVRAITTYLPQHDEKMIPRAVVPAQDIGPWQNALSDLLTLSERYFQVSADSRNAALRYVQSCDIATVETQLLSMVLNR